MNTTLCIYMYLESAIYYSFRKEPDPIYSEQRARIRSKVGGGGATFFLMFCLSCQLGFILAQGLYSPENNSFPFKNRTFSEGACCTRN